MNKFKVGDTIECIDTFNIEHPITFRKKYKVIEYDPEVNSFYDRVRIICDNGNAILFYVRRFNLANKQQPKDDIEWLDRVKENFKYV